jgi:RNA polymerase sigma-70 factor (ECF subfamily)
MINAGTEAISERGVDRRSMDCERRAGWDLLVEHHLAGAYRLAAIMLGDATEAQDVAHDSLLRAWHNWDSLRDITNIGAWFDRIVVNVCRDRLRHHRRTRILLPKLVADRQTADPASGVEDRDAIAHAFASLGPQCRATLTLRFFADLPIDEIAERLNVPPGTVKSRIHRCLRQLRRSMIESRDDQ